VALEALDDLTSKWVTFFRFAYGMDNEAFVCLCRRDIESGLWEDEFFKWPSEQDQILDFVARSIAGYDVYYCTQLFTRPERKKEWAGACPTSWADLDHCHPDELLIPPTITIESSPGRWQALWVYKEAIDPAQAEDVNRRIAYYHRAKGADTSGWDLTQVLRVPYTNNYKYNSPTAITVPIVNVTKATNDRYTFEDFNVYPQVKGYEYSEIPYPEEGNLAVLEPEAILDKYRHRLSPVLYNLYQVEPDEDWSKNLWQMEAILFETGMSREEVFVVCQSAACNKYKRDNKPPTLLWREVCRAFSQYVDLHTFVSQETKTSPLLTDEERDWAKNDITIVEEYIAWARNLGDAAWQYHQAGAFVILSSLLAGNVRLPTSFGTVTPNLWFMILADTTLTRKTTAMDVAMDLVADIDSDAVLATDGSIEGLFTSLSMRPGRPSVFLRDEFSGLLESITKKDYYAGMAETLTKLYDGKFQKRVLRKDVIEVRDPVLIMFAGGIKERVLSLLNYEHVASGFLPRFIFVTAESDLTRLRPLGPPTEATLEGRDRLVDKFTRLAEHYKQVTTVHLDGRTIEAARSFKATLTPDAWMRYNKLESDLLQSGMKGFNADVLTPCFDRLAKSGLKVAVLCAACRAPSDDIVVGVQDIIKAFWYVEQWREHTLNVLNNIGRTTAERQIELVRGAISKHEGITRSELMQKYHLTARDADTIFTTLDQRGQITRHKSGRTEKLFPIHM
jgi:hypothetical protein